MGLYAVVANNKLPWMQVVSAPKELIADIKDKRDLKARRYVAKIKDWFDTDLRPTVEILKPAEPNEETEIGTKSEEQKDKI